MKTTPKNIIVSEGQRPMWQIILASLLFTASIVCLFYGFIDLVILLIGVGLRFSVVINIYFDFEKRLYKKEYSAGLIRFGNWKYLPEIEYICVFKQGWRQDRDKNGVDEASGYKFDVNVWHNISKHFTIYSHSEKGPAYEMAKHLAIKLKVDFLDSSDPHNKVWVELNHEPSIITENTEFTIPVQTP